MKNGSSAAAIMAAGIGFAVTGIVTVFAEAIGPFHDWLVWSKPVGALSGKTTIGVAVWLVSWLILGLLWKGKEVSFKPTLTLSAVLMAVGLLFTFPPVWKIFAGG